MRNASLPVPAAVFALIFSLTMAGCPSHPDRPAGPENASAEPASEAVASGPGAGSDEAWMARLNSTAWETANNETVQELGDAVKHSGSLREAVLQRYCAESDHAAKAALRMALAADPAPSLVEQATAWAKAGNPSEQADGLWLLAEIGPTEQTAALAWQALMKAGDPELLAAALAALKPPEMPPPEEIPPVVARLRVLAQHDDPLVRSLSIQTMAEWDRPHRSAPETIMTALEDPDVQVRESAIVATGMAALRTSDVKTRLLKMLDNEAEDLRVREAAVWVLKPFSLTRAEYETYQRGRHDVMRLLNGTGKANNTEAQASRR